MSGHSKWSTIKRAKGTADAKRGALFTKLAKAIAVAARSGSDPTMNAPLRLVVDRAKAARMPKDNIERAIQRGSGGGPGTQLEEVMYEGFGPGGAAVLIHAVTDNRNRTVNEIRTILQRHGGSLGGTNSVAWQFAPTGTLLYPSHPDGAQALSLAAIEAGAEDVAAEGGRVVVRTKPDTLEAVKRALSARGFAAESSDLELTAAQAVPIPAEWRGRMLALLQELDDHPDVVDVNTNAELPEGP